MKQFPELMDSLPNHYFDETFKVGFMQFYIPYRKDDPLFKETKSDSILAFKVYKDFSIRRYYAEHFPRFLNIALDLKGKENVVFLYPPSSHTIADARDQRNDPERLKKFLTKIIPSINCENVELHELFQRIESVEPKSHNRLLHEQTISVNVNVRDKRKIKSSKIVIFDDVLTSGATMAACANLLEKELGSEKLDLYFITLAGTSNANLEKPNYHQIIHRKIQNPFGEPGEYL